MSRLKFSEKVLSNLCFVLFLVKLNNIESYAQQTLVNARPRDDLVRASHHHQQSSNKQALSNSRSEILSYHPFGTPAIVIDKSSNLRSGASLRHRGNNNSMPVAQARNLQYNEPDDTRVPFWNMAHMINSIDQIEPALRDGSNGIEVDISFDKRGYPTESFHGFPCDCGRHCYHREDLVRFVQYVARITQQPAQSRLQVILFDLKLKDLTMDQKEIGGRQLAMILHEHLYKPYQVFAATHLAGRRKDDLPMVVVASPPIRSVVSINHVQDGIFVKSFLNYMIENRLDLMGNNVGFDVGMNDNLNEISSMWNGFRGATLNIWQGDGLTNCANIIRGVDRLKDAISVRNGQGHFRKIYYWTADVMYQIRSVLRLGVDAILTNQPQRLVQVLEEPEFRVKYRLATPYDDPFAQFWIRPTAWSMSVPSLGELGETVENIKNTSANFVKTLPDGIVAAIKKVHNSLVASN